MALFPVSDVVLSPIGGVASAVISSAIGLVGFGALGLRMLTTPDAAWDQVPEISPEPVRQPSAI